MTLKTSKFGMIIYYPCMDCACFSAVADYYITIIWLCRLNYIKLKVILLNFFQLRIMIMTLCTSSPKLMIETLLRMKQLLVQADSWSWIEEFCITRLK